MEKFISLAFHLLLASLVMFQPAICSSNFTDQDALLRFQSAIEVDPMNTIKGGNWTAEANFCEWIGVVCSNRRQRVMALDLSHGSIPRDMDSLQKLQELYLGSNNLTGMIPRTISKVPEEVFNISSLQVLSLRGNSLSGSLLPSSELSLPNLEILILSDNGFGGNFLQYISKFSSLIRFDAGKNQLSGPIPTSLGNLKNLKLFAVASNQLIGETDGSELGFISALSNCQSLEILILEGNLLRGSIPESIRNLSSSLQFLFAPYCQIRGHIHGEMGFLKNLTFLELSDKDIVGNIPSSIGGLKSLQRLHLDNNHLEGRIPNEICNFTSLGELLRRQNRISGSIPNCIGNLSRLQKFTLSSNYMTSVIAVSLWNLEELIFLNLSLNSFNGGLPLDMGKMRAINSIDLSWNRLTGAISSSIQELKSLSSLNLSRNSFQGSIPQAIGNLKGLDFLNLSYNELSGTIPKSMEGLTYLQNLNLSFNKLPGEIPNGGPFKFLNSRSLGMKHFVEMRLFKSHLAKKMERNHQGTCHSDTIHYGSNCAIKSFDTECEVFRKIKHQNLVKVISTCTNTNLRALVLQYVPHRSLEKWLYSNNYNLEYGSEGKVLTKGDVYSFGILLLEARKKPTNEMFDADMSLMQWVGAATPDSA
ncbi:hypothetical protein NL676_034615 [Syzygium grande]|nr:hypothetical protein NL676_034615 [Syzygium grande]